MVLNRNDINNIAASIATQKFKKVTGNLLGNLGTSIGHNRSPIREAQSFYGRSSTDMYQFPTDVDVAGGVGSQGHYIMFNINQQDNAQLEFGGPNNKTSGRSNMEKASKQLSVDKPEIVYSTLSDGFQQQTFNGVDRFVVDGFVDKGELDDVGGSMMSKKYKESGKFQTAIQDAERAASGVYMKRAPTTRLKTAISLFMPASVSTTYGATYTDTQIGAGAALAIDIYDQIASGQNIDFKEALDKGGVALSESLMKIFLGTVGALPEMGGIREAAEARGGRDKGPRRGGPL